MPAHNSKSKADKKRIVLAEPTTKTKKLGVKREVDKDNPGIAWESRPTHNPTNKRIPDDEAKYLHRNGRRGLPSERELWARDANKRGVPLEQILIGTGFTVENLMSCLGIPREGHEKMYEYLCDCKQKHNSI